MDLELMFFSVISLHTANSNKWTIFLTDLLALVLAYTLHILTAISFTFFQRSERNTLTFLSLCISQVLMEKIFCFELRHYTHLIKLALLQLHHRASLTKLTNITSLHHNYNTCSNLILHHSNIPSHSSVFIHLQIQSDFQLPHLPFTFVSLAQKYVPYSISNYIWNTSKLLLLSGDVEINTGPQQIDQNPVLSSIYSNKIT